MSIDFRKLFALFLIFLNLSFVYSDESGSTLGVCCLELSEISGGQTQVVFGDYIGLDANGESFYACRSDQLYLGDAIDYSCDDYQPLFCEQNLQCYGNSGSAMNEHYYNSVNAKLFSNGINLDFSSQITFLEGRGYNLQNCDENSQWFTDSSCTILVSSGGNSGGGTGGDTGTDTGSDTSGGDSGVEIDYDSAYEVEDFEVSEGFSDAELNIPIGGSYDLDGETYNPSDSSNSNANVVTTICTLNKLDSYLGSKVACEAKPECFYNPEGISYLFSGLGGGIFDLDEADSCVPKNTIISCSDYKTESSCISNVAKYSQTNEGGSTSRNLENGCSWVESSSINSFEGAGGICISNYVNNTEDGYELEDFASRLNLVVNQGDSIENNYFYHNSEINSQEYTSKLLDTTQSFSFEVSELNSGNYVLFLGLKPEEVEGVNSSFNIDVILDKYDLEGNFIQSNLQLSPKNGYYFYNDYSQSDLNIYIPVYFNQIFLDSNVSKVEITISNPTKKVYIDSISFERVNLNGDNIFFKPLSIIPQAASSCSQCYEEGSYNTCTKEKSDSLGACSYMVSSSSQYYGYNFLETALGNNLTLNPYLQVEDKIRWQSQSLSNSQVFCELYDNSQDCNFGYVSSTYDGICKWDQVIGCFKDSNNNDIPDFEDMNTLLEVDSFNFNLDCDVVAPSVYVEVFGRNSNGDYIRLDEVEDGNKVGDLNLHYQGVDYLSEESCGDFGLQSKLYFTYTLNYDNGGNITKIEELNSNIDTLSFEDLFGSDLTEQVNSITYNFLDQSGNQAFSSDRVISTSKIDFYGPKIYFIEEGNFYDELEVTALDLVITPSNSVIEFRLEDETQIESCYMYLTQRGPRVAQFDERHLVVPNDENFYPLTNSQNFQIDLRRFINKTSEFGADFRFNLICSDSVNLPTAFSFNFNALFNLDFSNFYPNDLDLNYYNYQKDEILNSNSGYINKLNNNYFYFYSNEYLTCNFKLNNQGPSFEFNRYSVDINNGLNFTDLNTNINYSYKYDYFINFPQVGLNTLNLTCVNENEYQIENIYNYIIDNQNPSFSNYTITGNDVNVISSGDTYILTKPNLGNLIESRHNQGYVVNTFFNNLNFEVNLNGGNSFIENYYNLTYKNEEDVSGALINLNTQIDYDSINYSNFNSENMAEGERSFISEVSFGLTPTTSNSDLLFNSNNFKLSETERGLYEVSFNFSFFDKAGNTQTKEILFYVDNSTPSISFEGDIGRVDYSNKIIYTSSSNPSIDLTFTAPDYRVYSCDYYYTVDGTLFQGNYGENNSRFSLDIEDRTGFAINLEEISSIQLKFDCKDQNQESPSYNNGIFTLVFDNVAPKIENLIFSDNIYRYTPNNLATLAEVVKSIEFEFEEYEIARPTCTYKIENTQNSIHYCNSTWNSMNTEISGVDNFYISLFTPDSSYAEYNNSYVCDTTSNFWNSIPFDQPESFNLTISCEDVAGNIDTYVKKFNVTYVDESIGNVWFEYDKDMAYPRTDILRALNDDIEFVLGRDVIKTYPAQNTPGTFEASTGINLSLYPSLVQGENLDKLKIKVGSFEKFVSINKDTIKPEISIGSNYITDENKVYSSSIEINSNLIDSGSGINLNSISVFFHENDVPYLIYNSNNGNTSLKDTKFSSSDYQVVFNNLEEGYFIYGLDVFNLTYGNDYKFSVFVADNYNWVNSLETEIFNLEVYDVKLVENNNVKENPLTENQYLTNDNSMTFELNFLEGETPILDEEFTCNDLEIINTRNSDSFTTTLSADKTFIIPTGTNFGVDSNNLEVTISGNCKRDGEDYLPFSFNLIYDDVPLILNDINLVDESDNILYYSNSGADLESYIDSLEIELDDTNEKYVNCNLEFEESNTVNYDCDFSRNYEFEGDEYTILDLLIFNETISQGGVCVRSRSDSSNYPSNTEIEYTITCNDLLENNVDSETITKSLLIKYVDGNILEIDSQIDDSKNAEISFKGFDLLYNVDEVKIFNSSNGLVFNESLDINSLTSGVGNYDLSNKIDLTQYTNPELNFTLELYLNDILVDSKLFTINQDVSGPQIILNSPFVFNSAEKYFNPSIKINFTIEDQSNISKVMIKEGNTIIYNYELGELKGTSIPSNINIETVNNNFKLGQNSNENFTFTLKNLINFSKTDLGLYNFTIIAEDIFGQQSLFNNKFEISRSNLILEGNNLICYNDGTCFTNTSLTQATLRLDQLASDSIYSCNEIISNGLSLSLPFNLAESSNSNSISFSNLDLNLNGDSFSFDVICSDSYTNLDLFKTFTIIYDDINPEIVGLSYSSGNSNYYFSDFENSAFILNDGLRIIMNNTYETYLSCNVKSIDNTNYICNSSKLFNFSFNVGLLEGSTTQENLISAYFHQGGICYKESENLSNNLPIDEGKSDLETNLSYIVSCIDGAQNEVTKNFNLPLTYTNNAILGFDLIKVDSNSNPYLYKLEVRGGYFEDLDKLNFNLYYSNGTLIDYFEDPLMENRETDSDNYYIFNDQNSNVDLSHLEHGNYNLILIGFYDGDELNSRNSTIFIDKMAPVNETFQIETSEFSGQSFESSQTTISFEISDDSILKYVTLSNGTHLINLSENFDNYTSNSYEESLDLYLLYGTSYNFTIETEDIYGNKASFSKLYETKTIELSLIGEVICVDKNNCYTNTSNPKLNLTINPILNRVDYTCDLIIINFNGGRYMGSNNFTLNSENTHKALNNPGFINEGDSFSFDVACEDSRFNIDILETFEVTYDTVSPQILNLGYSSANYAHYFNDYPSSYFTLYDGLTLTMNDTSEKYLKCNVELISNEYYSCNNESFIFDALSFTNLDLPIKPLLSSHQLGEGICYKKSENLSNNLPITGTEDLITYMNYSISCEDGFGNENSKLLELPVIYTSDSILEFTLTPNGSDKFILEVRGGYFENIDELNFSISLGENLVSTFIPISSEIREGSSEIYYIFEENLDLSFLENTGIYTLSLVGTYEGIDLNQVKTQNVTIDRTPPKITPEITRVFDSEMNLTESKIKFKLDVEDLNSKLRNVSIYKNNPYTLGGQVYDNYTLIKNYSFLNSKSISTFEKEYTGKFGETIKFKIYAEDIQGNTNFTIEPYSFESMELFILGDFKVHNNLYYTDNLNPKINFTAWPFLVGLNYSCNSIDVDGLRVSNSFTLNSSNRYHELDFTSIGFGEENPIEFTVSCQNNLNDISKSQRFTLIYDNKIPEISNLEFINQDTYYFSDKINSVFYLNDQLRLTMEDTSETYLSCEVKPINNPDYICNGGAIKFDFLSSITQSTSDQKTFLSSHEDLGGICYKTSEDLNDDLPLNNTESDLVTYLKYEVNCVDAIGNNATTKFFNLPVIYTTNQILDFNLIPNSQDIYDLEVIGGYFEDINLLSFNLSLENGTYLGTYTPRSREKIDGMSDYNYTFNQKLDLSNLITGDHIIILSGNYDGSELNSFTETITIDRTAPELDLKLSNNVPVSNGKISSKNFELDLSVTDSSNLEEVRLSQGGELLESWNPDSESEFSQLNYLFEGNYGGEYNFILSATDIYGNTNSYDLEVLVINSGFVFEFNSDNQNVVFEGDTFYTNVKEPTFNIDFNRIGYVEEGNYYCRDLIFGTYDRSGNWIEYVISDLELENITSNIEGISIPSNVELNNGGTYKFSLTCGIGSAYIEEYSNEMYIVYDDIKPEINSFTIGGKNSFNLFGSDDRLIEINESLEITLNDTQEDYLTCSVSFENSQNIQCDDFLIGDINFNKNSDLTNIYSNTLNVFRSVQSSNYLCNFIEDPRPTSQNLENNLLTSVTCSDRLQEHTKVFDTKMNLVTEGLLDLEYEVNSISKKLDVSFDSILKINGDVKIYLDGELLFEGGVSESQENDIFSYLKTNIDISNFIGGVYELRVEYQEFNIKTNVDVDFEGPQISIGSSAVDGRSIYYSPNFDLNIEISDLMNQVDSFVLKLGNDEVLNYQNNEITNYDDNLITILSSNYGDKKVELDLGFNLEDVEDVSFELEARDDLGNLNSQYYNFKISNDYDLILVEDIENGIFVSKTQENTWLVTEKENLKVSFEFTKEGVDSCQFAGKGIYADPNGRFTIVFEEMGIDVYGNSADFSLKCFEGGFWTEYSLDVIYIDLLPDFVLISESGDFLLTENPYFERFELNSVIPEFYGGMKCNYYFDSSLTNSTNTWINSYIFEINFSTFIAGEYDLRIDCYNQLNQDHSASYKIVIEKDEPINLDVSIKINEELYSLSTSEETALRIPENNEFNLVVQSNKKNLYCDFKDPQESGVLNSIFGFISNIFSSESKTGLYGNAYIYESSSDLSLSETGIYYIDISCVADDGTIFDETSYYLEVVERESVEILGFNYN